MNDAYLGEGYQDYLLRVDCPLALQAARGTLLRCLAGCVWLTEEGVPGDLFLLPGQTYRVRGDGRVVAEPVHGTARVSVDAPTRIWAALGALRRLGVTYGRRINWT